MPLHVLADARYRGLYEWRRDKDRPSSNFPAIFYSGQTIWGLTLRITESLLDIMGDSAPGALIARTRDTISAYPFTSRD